ncbi:hypothetical protein THRCLA_06052 [Thraustotheca clavata]|uniref:Uncharacterized protein n=1 Tax=Thraustotheca clavata TaxID=74557 RepID=A0A1V9ZQN7_9STRA|nr:hypothetical protein THRCLA_06052 [Thraustotheca clavata]
MEKPKIKKLTKDKVQDVLNESNGKAVLDLTYRGIAAMDAHACDDLTVKKIDLSHNKLTRFNFAMAMPLTQLKITSNLLTDSGVADVSFCKQLITLDLSDNKLSRLPGASLRHCTHLKALVLTNNAITTLEWLPSMAQLTSLIVSHNRISEISEKALGKVKGLTKLSISHNKLKELPDLAVLENLSELRISNNQLTALPENLAKNRNLKIIDACHNAVDTWDGLENLSSLKNLKQLNLKGNPLCGQPLDPKSTIEDDAEKKEKKALDKKNKLYNFKMKRLFQGLIVRDGNRVLDKRTHGYVAPPKPDEEEKKLKRKFEKAQKKANKAKENSSEEKKSSKDDQEDNEESASKRQKVSKKKSKQEKPPKDDKPAKDDTSTQNTSTFLMDQSNDSSKSTNQDKKKSSKKDKYAKDSGVLGVVQVKKAKKSTVKSVPIDVTHLTTTTDVGMGGDSAWD